MQIDANDPKMIEQEKGREEKRRMRGISKFQNSNLEFYIEFNCIEKASGQNNRGEMKEEKEEEKGHTKKWKKIFSYFFEWKVDKSRRFESFVEILKEESD